MSNDVLPRAEGPGTRTVAVGVRSPPARDGPRSPGDVTSVLTPKPPLRPSPRPPVPPTERRLLGIFPPEGLVMIALLAAGFFALFFRWFYTQHLNSSTSIADWG